LFHRISAEEMMAMGTTDNSSGSPIAEKLSENAGRKLKPFLAKLSSLQLIDRQRSSAGILFHTRNRIPSINVLLKPL
jgi:hypothetical protein